MLATVDGQPVKHFTQWGELAPHSQQQLQLIESQIVEAREDSKLLDGITRLQGETGGSRTVGGAARQRSLERAAKAASDALKLLETQLWSDGERLGGLREAVVATLRDTEHARARLTRLKQAAAADDNASAYQRSHPGMAAPPDAAPVFIPLPRRPSVFLKNAVEKLYAAAEGFERGTLEMERNLRVTGRVHGHGAGGPGLEALLFALRGGFAKGDFGDFGDGGEGTGGDENTNDAALGHNLSWRAGPAELRAAVENAQRYFNKVGTDLARLHERVRRAKAEHLALLRRRGKYFPFTTFRRLIAHTRLTFLFYNLRRPPGGGRGGGRGGAGVRAGKRRSDTPGVRHGAARGVTRGGGGGFPFPHRAESETETSLGGWCRRREVREGGGCSGGRLWRRPRWGGGLFGAPAAAGGGLFGASGAVPAGGGLFGAAAPAASGGLFGAAAPAAGGGLFGASAPAQAGGGLFGASAPAAGGGLFGASASAPSPGLFSTAPTPIPGGMGGGLFGSPAPAAAAGFGSPAPAGGGGLFGAPSPATGGGLFGAPSATGGGFGTPGAFGAPATQQPRRSRRR